ncbi:MAG: hypothetical protein ACRCUT_08425 [Spirochaetota bacterium]
MLSNIVCSIKVNGEIYSGLLKERGVNGAVSFPGGEAVVAADKDNFQCVLKISESCFIESFSLSGSIPASADDTFLKNGFQSWSYSGALGSEDAQKRPWLSFVNALQENVKNIPTGKKGCHTSEMFCFIGEQSTGIGILAAQYPPFNQYVEYECALGSGRIPLLPTSQSFMCLIPMF